MNISSRIQGAIYGAALGDGFGFPTEFKSFRDICVHWPPHGPMAPEGNPIHVTDDTQMSLAVGKALMQCYPDAWQPDKIADALVKTFIEWLNDPENNRAPGMTCLVVCEELERGTHWLQATARHSKGCGANMRVLPVALLGAKGISHTEIGQLAQLQSAITHGHPTALAASEITAIAIAHLVEGLAADQLLTTLIQHAQSQREIYHERYLQTVWEGPAMPSAQAYIQRGWEEVIAQLERVEKALPMYEAGSDPCVYTGMGWIAEEAFGTALFCFLLSPDNPEEVLRRAVATGGDSDSIACLAGAMVGAYCGIEALPQEWLARVEYQTELQELASFY